VETLGDVDWLPADLEIIEQVKKLLQRRTNLPHRKDSL
jgi:hypothetical protein